MSVHHRLSVQLAGPPETAAWPIACAREQSRNGNVKGAPRLITGSGVRDAL